MAAGAARAPAAWPSQAADRASTTANPPGSEPAADPQLPSVPADENGQAVGDALSDPVDHAPADHDGAELAVARLSLALSDTHGSAELAAAYGERA